MSNLTTLVAVKTYLGITTTATDTLLSQMIAGASSAMQAFMNRDIVQSDYTEFRDGTGHQIMMVGNYPLLSVASVSVNGIAIPAATDFVTPGYRFTDTQIVLQGHTFCRGYANVALAYSAGYAAVPAALADACNVLVGTKFKGRDFLGVQSKTLAQETIVFSQKDFPAEVKSVLNNFKKVIPV